MSRHRRLPCNPRLDSILEHYFAPEGASIKSISAVAARGTTSPVSLNRRDVSAETSKLMRGLTSDELEEIRLYYVWRAVGDFATRKATDARQEARKRAKRRVFKTGIREIERKWNERKTARR